MPSCVSGTGTAPGEPSGPFVSAVAAAGPGGEVVPEAGAVPSLLVGVAAVAAVGEEVESSDGAASPRCFPEPFGSVPSVRASDMVELTP